MLMPHTMLMSTSMSTCLRRQLAISTQAVHDELYSQRRTSPEQRRLMRDVVRSKSPQKAAKKAGLIAAVEPINSPSPYFLP